MLLDKLMSRSIRDLNSHVEWIVEKQNFTVCKNHTAHVSPMGFPLFSTNTFSLPTYGSLIRTTWRHFLTQRVSRQSRIKKLSLT